MNEPRIESRVHSLESRASKLEAGIGELASDTAEEFKSLRQDVQQGFAQAHDFVQEHFAEMNVRFEQVNNRLDRIEATQANQGKMLQEHGELLKQLLAKLDK